MNNDFRSQVRLTGVLAGMIIATIVFIVSENVALVERAIVSIGIGLAVYVFFYFDRGRRGINLAQLFGAGIVIAITIGILKLLGYM